MKNTALFTALVFTALSTFAQGGNESFMRSNQKMYVAVAVLLLILLGLLAFLFSLEKRIKALEKR
ncbi:MAG: CcmD family protein [Chitinophagales bacterium]|mgnify:CR=1 FL=1|nr:CcmD family protein [Chitinophagales bacterium]